MAEHLPKQRRVRDGAGWGHGVGFAESLWAGTPLITWVPLWSSYCRW